MKKLSAFYQRLNHAHQVFLLAAVVLSMAALATTAAAAPETPQFMFVQSADDLKVDPAESTLEVSWTNFGILKNLSYWGAYFMFNDNPPLEQGQIRDFSITSTEEHSDFPGANFINGTSRVVRIDPPKTGDHDIGIALEFISAKFFDFLIKSS